MNKQPTEILLLFTDYLNNRDSIASFRLSSSFWASHRSPAGRYRLKACDERNVIRPSSFSVSSLIPIDRSPSVGHFLLNNLCLSSFTDFPLLFPSSAGFFFSHGKSKEFPQIFKNAKRLRIEFKEISRRTVARPNSKIPYPIENIPYYDRDGHKNTQMVDFASFPHLEELRLRESIEFPLQPGVFPSTLRELHLGWKMNNGIPEGILPDSLEELSLMYYNQPLPDRLPNGLKILNLGSNYNQPLRKGQLPSGLKILQLSASFDLPIEPNCLPIGLEEFHFTTARFRHPFLPGIFPNSLKRLTFHQYTGYSHPIPPGVLPDGLETLELCLGRNYSYPCPPLPIGLKSLKIECPPPQDFLNLSQLESLRFGNSVNRLARGIFPPSLTDLRLGYRFNEALVEGIFPIGLKKLWLGTSFNQMLPIGIFPSSLNEIRFGSDYNLPPTIGIFPEGLKKITDEYNYPILPGLSPQTIETIFFGQNSKYNQSLSIGVFPIGLKKIRFGRNYDQKLPVGIFPPGVHTIELGENFSHRLEAGLFPPSVRKLTISIAHPLPLGLFPDGLEEIEFDKFNQLLLPGLFPPSLRRLKFRNVLYQNILPGVLPEGLCELSLGKHFLGFFPLSALPPYFHPDPPSDNRRTSEAFYLPYPASYNHDNYSTQMEALIARVGADRPFFKRLCRVPLLIYHSIDSYFLAEPLDGGESFIVSRDWLGPKEEE